MNRKEIRDHIRDHSRETQINDLINSMINNTLDEIQSPGWAFTPRRQHHHFWNFNRRKTTLLTVANQEDYILNRDVDQIGLIRQTTSPVKLTQIPDDKFYSIVPNPTATGNPSFYRLWEVTGVQTEISTDEAVSVVSDSASDSSQSISVTGYVSTDGRKRTETINLNGTTTSNGSVVFKSNQQLLISKSGSTSGNLTIKGVTSATTLVVLSPNETSARFKQISFYPIPSSAITLYIEYFDRIGHLFNDSDEPNIPKEWHWVVEEGALAKIYEYKQAETMQRQTQNVYASAVQAMIQSDISSFDLITRLRSSAQDRVKPGIVEITDNSYAPYL